MPNVPGIGGQGLPKYGDVVWGDRRSCDHEWCVRCVLGERRSSQVGGGFAGGYMEQEHQLGEPQSAQQGRVSFDRESSAGTQLRTWPMSSSLGRMRR